MTSKDKLNICKKSVQVTKLSEILEAELISDERDFGKFWNSYSNEISKNLWCPLKIDLPESEPANYLPGSLKNSEQNLQYLIKHELNPQQKDLPKIYSKLLRFSPQGITDKENIKTRKIRFYPNQAQKTFFNKCFNAHRYFYNKALEFVNKEKDKFKKDENNNTIYPSLPNIRDNIIIANTQLTEETKWIKEIPYDVRQNAIKSLLGSLKSSKTLLRNKQQTHSTLHFLTKKTRSRVCHFPKKALMPGFNIAPKKLGIDSTLKFRTNMKKWMDKYGCTEGDFTIHKNSANRYYLCLIQKPGAVAKYNKKTDNRKEIVSLDPGCRTFQTCYSTTECSLIGSERMLAKLHDRIDKLKSLACKAKSKTKYHMLRRCTLLRTKITNKVNDLHWQTASYLTKKYKVILIPDFGTKHIVETTKNSHMHRNILQLSHFAFKQKLKYCAKQNHSIVIECSEASTSKTCGGCGNIYKIGCSEEYVCKFCKLHIHRDVNGARNIFIRSLTKYYTFIEG